MSVLKDSLFVTGHLVAVTVVSFIHSLIRLCLRTLVPSFVRLFILS